MAHTWAWSRTSRRTRASRRPAAPLALTLVHALVLLLLFSILTGCIATPPPPSAPTRLHVSGAYRLSTASAPLGLTAGPDGTVWFTQPGAIGRITPSDPPGAISTFPLPYPNPTGAYPRPEHITLGPDGALWFTDRGTNQIGRITTAGVVTEFALGPPSTGYLQGITAGPDGALWFTRIVRNGIQPSDAIGRITTSGTITEFALPTYAEPQDILAGPDGALWFTELDGATAGIGRITTAGSISAFPLPKGSGAWRITAGPDGAIWFTEHGAADRIGRMTTSGAVREFPIPYRCSKYPWGIVAGPDHALWFTETFGPKLGRVTVAGVFSDAFSGAFTYQGGAKSQASCQGGELVPQSDDAREIIVGPDGNLWVAELTEKAIWRYVIASTPST